MKTIGVLVALALLGFGVERLDADDGRGRIDGGGEY